MWAGLGKYQSNDDWDRHQWIKYWLWEVLEYDEKWMIAMRQNCGELKRKDQREARWLGMLM